MRRGRSAGTRQWPRERQRGETRRATRLNLRLPQELLLPLTILAPLLHQNRPDGDEDEVEDEYLRALTISSPDVPLKYRVGQCQHRREYQYRERLPKPELQSEPDTHHEQRKGDPPGNHLRQSYQLTQARQLPRERREEKVREPERHGRQRARGRGHVNLLPEARVRATREVVAAALNSLKVGVSVHLVSGRPQHAHVRERDSECEYHHELPHETPGRLLAHAYHERAADGRRRHVEDVEAEAEQPVEREDEHRAVLDARLLAELQGREHRQHEQEDYRPVLQPLRRPEDEARIEGDGQRSELRDAHVLEDVSRAEKDEGRSGRADDGVEELHGEHVSPDDHVERAHRV